MLGAASCSTQRSAAEKAAAARQTAAQVEDSVEARSFRLDLSFVYPQRFQPRSLAYGYDLVVRGDSIASNLPYYGRAYRTDITRNHVSPLCFKSKISLWQVTRTQKHTGIRFVTRVNFEQLRYDITLYPDGSANLSVTSTDREPISFDGEMYLSPSETRSGNTRTDSVTTAR